MPCPVWGGITPTLAPRFRPRGFFGLASGLGLGTAIALGDGMSDGANTVYEWTFDPRSVTLLGHRKGCQAATGTKNRWYVESGTVAEMRDGHAHCKIKLCPCTK